MRARDCGNRAAAITDIRKRREKSLLGRERFSRRRLRRWRYRRPLGQLPQSERAFTDGKPTSIGIHGGVTKGNAPTILNALYNKTQFWDGPGEDAGDQAALAGRQFSEMGQPSLEAAIARIGAIENTSRPSRRSSAAAQRIRPWCAPCVYETHSVHSISF